MKEIVIKQWFSIVTKDMVLLCTRWIMIKRPVYGDILAVKPPLFDKHFGCLVDTPRLEKNTKRGRFVCFNF